MSSVEQTETMSNLALEDEGAFAGIGWVDIEDNVLFGVDKIVKEKFVYNNYGIATSNRLHKNLWYKIRTVFPQYACKYKDYTQCPRFRVFYYKNEVPHWRLLCGDEIANSENAKTLIFNEFMLYDTDCEIIIDPHWQIGHGWSKEYMDGLSF